MFKYCDNSLLDMLPAGRGIQGVNFKRQYLGNQEVLEIFETIVGNNTKF